MDAKKLNFTPLYLILVVMAGLLGLVVAAKSTGFVVNMTPSMPGLLYKTGGGEKGSVVSFCSPVPRRGGALYGPCPDFTMPLLKRVVAGAGDFVEVSDAGVRINGELLANSMPLDLDSAGKNLPHLRVGFVLKPGQIWVAGEHANSFDSRYFGPISLSSLRR